MSADALLSRRAEPLEDQTLSDSEESEADDSFASLPLPPPPRKQPVSTKNTVDLEKQSSSEEHPENYFRADNATPSASVHQRSPDTVSFQAKPYCPPRDSQETGNDYTYSSLLLEETPRPPSQSILTALERDRQCDSPSGEGELSPRRPLSRHGSAPASEKAMSWTSIASGLSAFESMPTPPPPYPHPSAADSPTDKGMTAPAACRNAGTKEQHIARTGPSGTSSVYERETPNQLSERDPSLLSSRQVSWPMGCLAYDSLEHFLSTIDDNLFRGNERRLSTDTVGNSHNSPHLSGNAILTIRAAVAEKERQIHRKERRDRQRTALTAKAKAAIVEGRLRKRHRAAGLIQRQWKVYWSRLSAERAIHCRARVRSTLAALCILSWWKRRLEIISETQEYRTREFQEQMERAIKRERKKEMPAPRIYSALSTGESDQNVIKSKEKSDSEEEKDGSVIGEEPARSGEGAILRNVRVHESASSSTSKRKRARTVEDRPLPVIETTQSGEDPFVRQLRLAGVIGEGEKLNVDTPSESNFLEGNNAVVLRTGAEEDHQVWTSKLRAIIVGYRTRLIFNHRICSSIKMEINDIEKMSADPSGHGVNEEQLHAMKKAKKQQLISLFSHPPTKIFVTKRKSVGAEKRSMLRRSAPSVIPKPDARTPMRRRAIRKDKDDTFKTDATKSKAQTDEETLAQPGSEAIQRSRESTSQSTDKMEGPANDDKRDKRRNSTIASADQETAVEDNKSRAKFTFLKRRSKATVPQKLDWSRAKPKVDCRLDRRGVGGNVTPSESEISLGSFQNPIGGIRSSMPTFVQGSRSPSETSPAFGTRWKNQVGHFVDENAHSNMDRDDGASLNTAKSFSAYPTKAPLFEPLEYNPAADDGRLWIGGYGTNMLDRLEAELHSTKEAWVDEEGHETREEERRYELDRRLKGRAQITSSGNVEGAWQAALSNSRLMFSRRGQRRGERATSIFGEQHDLIQTAASSSPPSETVKAASPNMTRDRVGALESLFTEVYSGRLGKSQRANDAKFLRKDDARQARVSIRDLEERFENLRVGLREVPARQGNAYFR